MGEERSVKNRTKELPVTAFYRTIRPGLLATAYSVVLLSSAALAESGQPAQPSPAVAKAPSVAAAPAPAPVKRPVAAAHPTVRPAKVNMVAAAPARRTEVASACVPLICGRYLLLGVAY